MKLTLCLFAGLLAGFSLASAQTTIVIGNAASGATTGYDWTTLALTGTTDTFTVTINEPGILTGTFDLTFGATSTSPATTSLATFLDRLAIDRSDVTGAADDRNINGVEVLSLTISNILLTSLDGGTPELRLNGFSSFDFNTTETFDVKMNGVTVLNAAGEGAAGSNLVLSFSLGGVILEDEDLFTWTATPNAANYRMNTFTFEAVSVAAVPEPQTYALIFGLAAAVAVGVRRRRDR